jgi:hypothetical protein
MGYILTSSSKITCPHGGPVQHYSRQLQVPYIHGNPVCVMSDRYDISGCPLWGDLRCARVEWWSGSVLYAGGSRILTHKSKGGCYNSGSMILGVPVIVSYQMEYLADDES